MPETSVLKGAKSFPVFLTTFTVIHNETKRKISYDDYKKLPKEQQAEYKVYPAQQVYYVFNVDQTNLQETRPELYAKLGEANRALPPEVAADSYCFPAMDEMIKNNEWLCPIHVSDRWVSSSQSYYGKSVQDRGYGSPLLHFSPFYRYRGNFFDRRGSRIYDRIA